MSLEPVISDVLIVGLGPGGACAARAAAELGCTVIGIDRKHSAGIPVQCAEFVPTMLSPSLPNTNISACQKIREMRTYVQDQAVDLSENFTGFMLDRAKFDQSLVGVAEAAGADCQFGVSVTRISSDGTVFLSDGRRVAARVIIGADGPRSIVGEAINSTNEQLVFARQITVALREHHNATDIFLSDQFPEGYAWLFPRGDIANIGLGVGPSAKRNLKEALQSLHQKLFREGRVGGEILGQTGGLIPVGGLIKNIGDVDRIHVYLVGDAAGLTNPISGAGINAAVLSGELAGESAAKWLAGDKQDADLDYEEELESVFGASLRRALSKRRTLQSCYASGRTPSSQELRETWIAYPHYWHQDVLSEATRY